MKRPRSSQLTQSSFLSTLYGIQESIEDGAFNCDNADDFESTVGEVKSQLEELRDECQESFDNIPYQLQDNDVGQLLQERIEGLDEWINAIESVEISIDEDEIEDEAIQELKEEHIETENELENRIKEKTQEKIENIASELNDCDPGSL